MIVITTFIKSTKLGYFNDSTSYKISPKCITKSTVQT